MSDTEANKALVRRFFEEVMNKGNASISSMRSSRPST